MKKYFLLCLAFACVFGPLGAMAGLPKTFMKGLPSQWQVFEVRADMDATHA